MLCCVWMKPTMLLVAGSNSMIHVWWLKGSAMAIEYYALVGVGAGGAAVYGGCVGWLLALWGLDTAAMLWRTRNGELAVVHGLLTAVLGYTVLMRTRLLELSFYPALFISLLAAWMVELLFALYFMSRRAPARNAEQRKREQERTHLGRRTSKTAAATARKELRRVADVPQGVGRRL